MSTSFNTANSAHTTTYNNFMRGFLQSGGKFDATKFDVKNGDVQGGLNNQVAKVLKDNITNKEDFKAAIDRTRIPDHMKDKAKELADKSFPVQKRVNNAALDNKGLEGVNQAKKEKGIFDKLKDVVSPQKVKNEAPQRAKNEAPTRPQKVVPPSTGRAEVKPTQRVEDRPLRTDNSKFSRDFERLLDKVVSNTQFTGINDKAPFERMIMYDKEKLFAKLETISRQHTLSDEDIELCAFVQFVLLGSGIKNVIFAQGLDSKNGGAAVNDYNAILGKLDEIMFADRIGRSQVMDLANRIKGPSINQIMDDFQNDL
jgi:hypothetical protein